MALFSSFFNYARHTKAFHKNPHHSVIMAYLARVRSISSTEITKNITLLSGEKKIGRVANHKFKVEVEEDRPLVIMLSWLMAKRKHVFKYADFYISRGFDVMNVSITPWQLLWPAKGSQLLAVDILQFLDHNRTYAPIVLHGFSVGGYVWAEALVQLAAEPNRYQHILDRIVGQIWDSLADITELPEGFPFAIFPKNKVMQTALRQYIIYHLKTFDKVATCHYIRGSQMFHTNIVKAPALFFVSKSDPIGLERSNWRAKENWDNIGIQTYWKCWEKSPHVGHFHRYPDEYKAELSRFLDNIGLLGEKQDYQILSQVKAKL